MTSSDNFLPIAVIGEYQGREN